MSFTLASAYYSTIDDANSSILFQGPQWYHQNSESVSPKLPNNSYAVIDYGRLYNHTLWAAKIIFHRVHVTDFDYLRTCTFIVEQSSQ